MARETVRIDGLKELEAALSDMSRATARNTLVRALKKAAQPLVDSAKGKVPKRTGKLRDSIIATSKVRNLTGLAEFGQTLASGGSQGEAVAALRSARRSGGSEGSRAEISIGPTEFYGQFVEFGTVKMAAEPFMRPAFDGGKDRAVLDIKTELAAEIEKTRARAARKAARVAKG